MTDDERIHEHRQQKIARLERAIEEVIAEDYEVVHCVCGGDPVRGVGDSFCGTCGQRLVREGTPS